MKASFILRLFIAIFSVTVLTFINCDSEDVIDGQVQNPPIVDSDETDVTDDSENPVVAKQKRADDAIDEMMAYFSASRRTLNSASSSDKDAGTAGGRIEGECALDSTIYYTREAPKKKDDPKERISYRQTDDFFSVFRSPGFKIEDLKFPEEAVSHVTNERRGDKSFISYVFHIKEGYQLPNINPKHPLNIIYVNYSDPEHTACNSPYYTSIINYVAYKGSVVYDSTTVVSNIGLPDWLDLLSTEISSDALTLNGYFVKEEQVPHWPGFSTVDGYGDLKVKGFRNHFKQKITLSADGASNIEFERNYWYFFDMNEVYSPADHYNLDTGLEITEHIKLSDNVELERITLKPIYLTFNCNYSLESANESMREAFGDGRGAETGVIQWRKIENGQEVVKITYDKGTDYGKCQPDDSTYKITHTEGEIETITEVPRVATEGSGG